MDVALYSTNGEVLKENISEEQRILAQEQLVESLEWYKKEEGM